VLLQLLQRASSEERRVSLEVIRPLADQMVPQVVDFSELGVKSLEILALPDF
jgi:hypothetical protein